MDTTTRLRQLVEEVERRTNGQLSPEQVRIKAWKLLTIERRYNEEFAYH